MWAAIGASLWWFVSCSSDGGSAPEDLFCDESNPCPEGQKCQAGRCVSDCSEEATLCGSQKELCCTGEELCLFDGCVGPGAPCSFTEDCPSEEEYCETSIGRCLPRNGEAGMCEYVPPVREAFEPTEGCHWNAPTDPAPYASMGSVIMTPAVANLTDDNGDGRTDVGDTPDMAFVSFDEPRDGCCTERAVVRVVSGTCAEDGSMTTLATLAPSGAPEVGDSVDPHDWIDNSSGVALGNLHPAGTEAERTPEIVATSRVNNEGFAAVVAWRRVADDGSAWEVMWRNDTALRAGQHVFSIRPVPFSRASEGAGYQPLLADLTGDGQAEVIVGNVVLNGLDGSLLWDGLQANPDVANLGRGLNAFLGPNSTAADLDLDGRLEVIAGNTVYDGATGVVKPGWPYLYEGDNSECGGTGLPCDGYNAVGNFDGDPEGEVVAVRLGEVFVWNHDGSLVAPEGAGSEYRVAVPYDADVASSSLAASCSEEKNESGPPTVADFDGDGRPEIGTASAAFYVVVDFDCRGNPLPAGCDSRDILWKVANEDCSSRATGSSVFDFEGDGSAEVVYADESSFSVFDGRTGAVKFRDDSHRSHTRLEMPLVVDLDNDNRSEIIVPESIGDRVGIDVWRDTANEWVRTRRIWNQHAYYVTNISEDGQVPAQPEVNWLHPRLNSFRQNVQPDGLFDAPDLVVQGVVVDCVAPGSQSEIEVTVANRGVLSVPAGVMVYVEVVGDQGDRIPVATLQTTTRLLGGQSETLVTSWEFAESSPSSAFSVVATVDTDAQGQGSYNECREDNNTAQVEARSGCLLVI